jgi:hypothetical protein
MYEEEKFYVIEYYTGEEDSLSHDWTTLFDTFGEPYRFNTAEAALDKAKEIAEQGRWGQPIRVRVMKYIIRTEGWQIGEFDPKEHYRK